MDDILFLDNISKSYFGNVVLKNVSLRIKPGEIVSLVGENGAGKSTLMNILFGMEVIKNSGGFEGKIYFKGKNVNIDSPKSALKWGIGMIHQEFMLIDDFSIAENIKLNKENTIKGILTKPFRGLLDVLDKKAIGADARKALDTVGLSVDEWTKIAGLSVGTMQFIEIAKALENTKTELMIFDEPSSVLTESEAGALLDIIQKLSQKGIACIFISHRMDEILRISDTIVVLRDGEVVGNFKRGGVTAIELANRMVGRDAVAEKHEIRNFDNSPVMMSIHDLEVDMPGEFVKGFSIDIKEGEILGIGGLAGSGKLGIPNGLLGLYETRGKVEYKGKPLNIGDTREVLSRHIAFVSEDRKRVGLMLDETIEMNCILSSAIINNRFLKKYLGGRFINKKETKKAVEKIIKTLDIRCTNMNQKVGSLSGGNQQKVCMASMLLQEPEMLFASEPSRGIDIGAKVLILDYLMKLNREKNLTIVLISSELHELCSVCDRIAIVSEGKLAGILSADAPFREFGLLMTNIRKNMSAEQIKGDMTI
ncbi:MAG: sugar ABC transporter ATP-binding protein [Dysgonamonadaceae bacterium]|jgi:simple sugar transport system ATP-binding protein|nr:sugar ABC transporter ATP-binding protein [Dysgonamonadaceae bacterium]